MKKFTLSLLTLFSVGFTAVPAHASDLMIAAAMQRCATNEECTLVTNSCADNCGFVPVNRAHMAMLDAEYQKRCNKVMSANPVCTMNPPIAAACVNSRCTIDYAYANHAGAADYKPGAYPVPEQPVPSKVQGDYSNIDDRHGFTAYDLPQADIKQNTVGTINSTVYVPPSAPVSGDGYVPVAPVASPPPPPAPMAATPQAIAPAAAPTIMPPPAASAPPQPAYVPTPATPESGAMDTTMPARRTFSGVPARTSPSVTNP